jgi:hypothetical protein
VLYGSIRYKPYAQTNDPVRIKPMALTEHDLAAIRLAIEKDAAAVRHHDNRRSDARHRPRQLHGPDAKAGGRLVAVGDRYGRVRAAASDGMILDRRISARRACLGSDGGIARKA